ncbi:hypothetical protein [Aneurinibacillus uraniidurans]|uniref:hypothetical protein n=1 Tax=Aneurinibacillus uraniidurans TaxID=2966586 RepID=UPI00234A7390|nr:hypothetical protein [Aneurinibacillus sp. B1]WCN38948.1 hypothetical protein PO771_06005 [Aneurinibacillus sp. B1]
MEIVYSVILSFIALLLLFGASYLLAVLMNKAVASTEWQTLHEPAHTGVESLEQEQKDRS